MEMVGTVRRNSLLSRRFSFFKKRLEINIGCYTMANSDGRNMGIHYIVISLLCYSNF